MREPNKTPKKKGPLSPLFVELTEGCPLYERGRRHGKPEIMLAAMVSGNEKTRRLGHDVGNNGAVFFIVLCLIFFAATYSWPDWPGYRSNGIPFLVAVLLGRLLVEASSPLSQLIGLGFGATALWYITLVAAGAMLSEYLINLEPLWSTIHPFFFPCSWNKACCTVPFLSVLVWLLPRVWGIPKRDWTSSKQVFKPDWSMQRWRWW